MEGRLVLVVSALMLFAATGKADLISSDSLLNITGSGCGVTKVCVELPDRCDPADNQTCLFMSGIASPPMDSDIINLTVELSGQSSGYIALVLITNASETTTIGFICGQNPSDNDTFVFSEVERNNTDGSITPTNTTASEIQGSVEGNLIQCEFTVPVLNTNYSILLGNGDINADLGLGPLSVALVSGPVDFTNPSSSLNATIAPTTIPSNTTSPPTGASGAPQPHALLLLLSILPLSVLQKA